MDHGSTAAEGKDMLSRTSPLSALLSRSSAHPANSSSLLLYLSISLSVCLYIYLYIYIYIL